MKNNSQKVTIQYLSEMQPRNTSGASLSQDIPSQDKLLPKEQTKYYKTKTIKTEKMIIKFHK